MNNKTVFKSGQTSFIVWIISTAVTVLVMRHSSGTGSYYFDGSIFIVSVCSSILSFVDTVKHIVIYFKEDNIRAGDVQRQLTLFKQCRGKTLYTICQTPETIIGLKKEAVIIKYHYFYSGGGHKMSISSPRNIRGIRLYDGHYVTSSLFEEHSDYEWEHILNKSTEDAKLCEEQLRKYYGGEYIEYIL